MNNIIKIQIGIDCEPCRPRPNTYINKVENILNLSSDQRGKEPVSKFFGAWEWQYEINEENWEEINILLREYFSSLYEMRKIRGAEWKILESED